MSEEKKTTARKSNKKNIILIVICSIMAVILAVILAVYLLIRSYVNKINYIDPDEWDINMTQDANNPTEETNPTFDAQVNESGKEFVNNSESIDKSYVKNYALIGVDNRHFEKITSNPGNADVIMILSVNTKANKVFITSIMRDTAAYIDYTPEMEEKHKNYKDGYDKINAANARGGPEFLLDTIEANFKIKIDDYILVDFYSLIDIIDILGGIPMKVSDAEAAAANNYIRDMEHDIYVQNHNLSDEGFEPKNLLSGGGDLILNGVQAVGFARERQTEGSDYTRTSRQRAVIEQIIIKAKKMSVSKLDEMANAVLPKVYTNMTTNEITALISEAVTYLGYDIVQNRIPFDGLYTSENGNLMPMYKETVEKFHDIIFEE